MSLINQLINELQHINKVCDSIHTVEKSQVQYVRTEANKLFQV